MQTTLFLKSDREDTNLVMLAYVESYSNYRNNIETFSGERKRVGLTQKIGANYLPLCQDHSMYGVQV